VFTQHIVINHRYPGLNPVQFGYENCDPRHSYGPAVRSEWLLHYVVSGFGIFRRGGKTYRVGPGEIFVIPPYLETYYEADAEKPWYYIWIGFDADLPLPPPFSRAVIRCPGVGEVFDRMRRSESMDGGKSAYLSSCLWELVSLVQESGKERFSYIEKALAFMHAEYMNGVSVGQLAEHLGVDRSYFSTLFKSSVGVPPVVYLTNLRLEKAAELMTAYGESPTIAAASVGYADLFSFSKAFKQKFGVSPREYVREYRAKTALEAGEAGQT